MIGGVVAHINYLMVAGPSVIQTGIFRAVMVIGAQIVRILSVCALNV